MQTAEVNVSSLSLRLARFLRLNMQYDIFTLKARRECKLLQDWLLLFFLYGAEPCHRRQRWRPCDAELCVLWNPDELSWAHGVFPTCAQSIQILQSLTPHRSPPAFYFSSHQWILKATFVAKSHRIVSCCIVLCQIHTADADATKLSSCVTSAVWTHQSAVVTQFTISCADKWRHNDVIVEKVIKKFTNITLHSRFECLQTFSVICYVMSWHWLQNCKPGHGRRLRSHRRIRRQSSWACSCEFMYTPPTRRNSTKFRRVGGVYWALRTCQTEVVECRWWRNLYPSLTT